jgi:hypothetical protein
MKRATLRRMRTETPILQLHDLQGNVIATVRDNENETELLTKYNSTEFGVPTGKEPPPKYAWLGAAGVAGELPSGVITQDGVTYVPIIGRPLQTEGIPLPLPENAATPLSRPFEAWVGSKAGEGAARELDIANEERKKREEANKPPGAIPVPVGGEEGGVEEEGGGGCSGMNACAAAHHSGFIDEGETGNDGYGCNVWGSWGSGEFLDGEISGWGHWECHSGDVPQFEMQIEAYGWGAKEFEGQTVMLGEAGSHQAHHEYWKDKPGGKFERTWKCPATGSYYHLWVWGRQMGSHGRTQWTETGWEGEVGSCTHQGPVDLSPIGEGAEES